MHSYGHISEAQRDEIWRLRELGESVSEIARRLGMRRPSVHWFLAAAGGRRPLRVVRSDGRISVAERREIAEGLALGLSCRLIAVRIGRAPSTISREVGRNGGRSRYEAASAEAATRVRARRPKPSKLARHPVLRQEVEHRLQLRWSPEQIAGWLPRAYPVDVDMRVSHETIYRSLFEQRRGALRKDLAFFLRTGRAMRRPLRKALPQGRGQLNGMVSIRKRPAEARGRLVPGHWEGDLVLGKAASAVVTLVERTSRYVVILVLPHGFRSDRVREALVLGITALPAELRRSLTWDQGKEMAEHIELTASTGMAVYFCNPHSPWQRGSNENTNGLLRQYLPKRRNLGVLTQQHVDAIAAELNGRPRETLGWMSPAERLGAVMGWTNVPKGSPWGTAIQPASVSSADAVAS